MSNGGTITKGMQMDGAERKTDDHLGSGDMNLSGIKYCINILATQLMLSSRVTHTECKQYNR